MEVVKLVGLRELESVEIGCECFRKEWRGEVDQSHCDLYLKACERLKELKIGRGSFGNCERFVAEGLPSWWRLAIYTRMVGDSLEQVLN